MLMKCVTMSGFYKQNSGETRGWLVGLLRHLVQNWWCGVVAEVWNADDGREPGSLLKQSLNRVKPPQK